MAYNYQPYGGCDAHYRLHPGKSKVGTGWKAGDTEPQYDQGRLGSVTVLVTVKNVGAATIELAKVAVNFRDAQGRLIDSSSDAVMNLSPGESWDFEITCPGADCSRVKDYEIETMAGTSSAG